MPSISIVGTLARPFRPAAGQGVGPSGNGVVAVGTRTLSEAGTVGTWAREQVRGRAKAWRGSSCWLAAPQPRHGSYGYAPAGVVQASSRAAWRLLSGWGRRAGLTPPPTTTTTHTLSSPVSSPHTHTHTRSPPLPTTLTPQVELFCISKLINCVLEPDEEFLAMDFHFAVGDGGLRAVLQLLHLFLEQPRWVCGFVVWAGGGERGGGAAAAFPAGESWAIGGEGSRLSMPAQCAAVECTYCLSAATVQHTPPPAARCAPPTLVQVG